MPDHVMVAELFGPTIQGEGAMAGTVSHFLRTFGCGYRCSWCDSMHAVDPAYSDRAERLTQSQIIDRVLQLGPAPWLTITGGDPVAWDLTETVHELSRSGYKIAVETQGSLWRDWLEECYLVTCSPKGPSSGMADRLEPAVLQKYHVRLRGRLFYKIVVFNDDDLDFAERIHRFMSGVPMYLSSGTPLDATTDLVLDRYRWLATAVLARPRLADCAILPQLHVLIWGHEKGR